MKTWKLFLQVLGLQQLRARQFRWNIHFTKNWLLSRRLFCVRKAVTWLNTTIEYGYTLVIKGWTWQQQYSGRLWRLNNAQLVLRGPKCTKKSTPPPAWTVETRQDGSMLSYYLCQILTLPSECHNRNRDSSDKATFFKSSIVQFWGACANWSLCFLFLTERSDTRYGLLLL